MTTQFAPSPIKPNGVPFPSAETASAPAPELDSDVGEAMLPDDPLPPRIFRTLNWVEDVGPNRLICVIVALSHLGVTMELFGLVAGFMNTGLAIQPRFLLVALGTVVLTAGLLLGLLFGANIKRDQTQLYRLSEREHDHGVIQSSLEAVTAERDQLKRDLAARKNGQGMPRPNN